MLEQTSHDFREMFLLKLTKELIENTNYYRGFRVNLEAEKILMAKAGKREEDAAILNKLNAPKLIDMQKNSQKMIEEQKKKILADIRKKIKEESEKASSMKKSDLAEELSSFSRKFQRPMPSFMPSMQQQVFQRRFPQPLKIPEQPLPETVSYVRPVAVSQEIDLGRINSLVNDPLVKVIECNGPDENVYVIGIMGRKKTPIKLGKDEISQIINTFSETAKIPATEGLFKAAVGSLVISAVVSEVVSAQFVIRKIAQQEY